MSVYITSYYGTSTMAENNAKMITLDTTSIYFSYGTVVAFNIGEGLKVINNYWGPTTGKHLNAIDGGTKEAKAKRLNQEEFNAIVDTLKIMQMI